MGESDNILLTKILGILASLLCMRECASEGYRTLEDFGIVSSAVNSISQIDRKSPEYRISYLVYTVNTLHLLDGLSIGSIKIYYI